MSKVKNRMSVTKKFMGVASVVSFMFCLEGENSKLSNKGNWAEALVGKIA